MEHNRVIYSKAYDSEVEYLSNGYIDTGIYANKNTKIELGFHINSFGTMGGGIIGVHTTESGHPSFAILLNRIGTSGSYTGKLAYDNFNVKGNNTNIVFDELYVYHTLIYQDGLLKCDNDEEEVHFGNKQTLDTMFLMRSNGSSFSCPIAIYYCKIWNNDTLVRDYIPVRKGSTGFMYDKVSKKLFANKGTGNFTLGNDVENPVPKIRRAMPMPYDSKVEYLESTGTQYIDTQQYVKNGLSINIKFVRTGNESTDVNMIFGTYTDYHDAPRVQSYYSKIGNKHNVIRGGTGTSSVSPNNSIYNINKLYSLTVTISSANTDTYYPIALFARCNDINSNSNAKRYNCFAKGLRIYTAKFNYNGICTLDLIPVRKGSTGYMYDKVSGKLFANQGTGNFILGPDVANPIPNIRRVFRFGNKRFVMPMPYDSKVEYLESTGTCYINTEYSAGTDVKIEIDFKFNDNGGVRNQRLIGKSVGGECAIRLIANETPYINFYVWDKEYKYYNNLYDRNFVTFSKNKVSINGVNLGALTFNTSYKDGSFTLWSSLDNYTRIYSCKLWNGSTLVRDFIPVRIGSVGYMYDKVTGKLFGNSGTGQFILGNDIN